MNMIDEKDPGQESVKSDSSDDELIIDLTDEVEVRAKDADGISELPEKTAADPQQALEDDHPFDRVFDLIVAAWSEEEIVIRQGNKVVPQPLVHADDI